MTPLDYMAIRTEMDRLARTTTTIDWDSSTLSDPANAADAAAAAALFARAAFKIMFAKGGVATTSPLSADTSISISNLAQSAPMQATSPGCWFRLPQSVRLRIYQLTLEITPRLLVYETAHRIRTSYGKLKHKFPFRRSVRRQPCILSICRESRAFAYGMGFPGAFNQPLLWFFPASDIVYFNRLRQWHLFELSVMRGLTDNSDCGLPEHRKWVEDCAVIQQLGLFGWDRALWMMTEVWENFTPQLILLPHLDVIHHIIATPQLDLWRPQWSQNSSEPWWTWTRKPTLSPIRLRPGEQHLAINNVRFGLMGVSCTSWAEIEKYGNVYLREELGRDIRLIGWQISRMTTVHSSVAQKLRYNPELAPELLSGEDLRLWNRKHGIRNENDGAVTDVANDQDIIMSDAA
jgi:hypothetical protein